MPPRIPLPAKYIKNLDNTKLGITNLTKSNILAIIQNRKAQMQQPALVKEDLQAMQAHAREAAALMKALANENRLMILCTLVDGEMSVGELNEKVPLSQSALSQHLASLRQAGLVCTRKEAQTVFYQLSGDEATRVIAVLQSIYCPTEATHEVTRDET